MASDHQTQAGKPQPLNPKVGILLEGRAGNIYMPSQLLPSWCSFSALSLGGLSLPQLHTWGQFPVPFPTHLSARHQLQILEN